ncbi:uncharacterized protein TOT_030000082 [Theileria orientalis strain Shintoku]|uniref:Uncharacterized protein n=1 Tax=Theileria orientalis strain Shintoku TaxID=869250 RepID=J4D8K5_THEOR|nr:uncharacterized protein TOT_030000082 [Theileria orientalis strain Shintoku]PVC49968.1 hypothetical protein MACL_00002637 [Theileria orientalis]BAM40820.1 uncharacterized protein TOT_030000082 [Theileria orientalis strain Shintoku]|eukprot:XP_009691121.1 uncharacterized protein TOT_030000082 [Theileria orientalis strain Shintoku]
MGRFKLFNCFGKSKSATNAQILKLKAQRDDLDQQKTELEARLANFNDLCLKFLKENNRDQALFILKRKALVSKQLTVLEDFSFKILELISETETALMEADVNHNLEIGAKLLEEINKELQREELEAFSDSDKENLNELAASLGVVSRNFEVDDLELVQELDLLTSDLHTISYDHPSTRSTPKENPQFDLDLSRLKSLSQSNSVANTTNRSEAPAPAE